MKLRCILLLLCFVQAASLSAQDRLRFKHLTISDGLSSNNLHTVCQDRYGFIWIGTEEGLNRYDGYQFHVFKNSESDPHSISNDNINDLLLDSDSVLWVATSFGLCRFNTWSEQFDNFFDRENDTAVLHAGQLVYKIIEDPKHRIYAATESGVMCLDASRTEAYALRSDNDSLSEFLADGVNFLQYINGRFLIGSAAGKGMYQCVLSDDGTAFMPIGKPDTLQDTYTGVLPMDENTNMVVGNRGVYLFNDKLQKAFPVYANIPGVQQVTPPAGSVVRFQDGRIFISLYYSTNDVNGIALYQPSDTSLHIENFRAEDVTGLTWGQCPFVFESSDHLIWVTSSRGLNVLDPSKQEINVHVQFPVLHFNQKDNIYSISRIGDLLILGSDGGGSFTYDLNTNAFKPLDVPDRERMNSMYGILPLGGSEFLAGTQQNGVFQVDLARRTSKRLIYLGGAERTNPYNAGAMIMENDSIIWVGWMGLGLSRINILTGKITQFRHHENDPGSISSDQVSSLYYDGERYIWFGTSDGINTITPSMGAGLDRMDIHTGKIDHFTHRTNDPWSLSNDNITDIAGDEKGNIWIGTRKGLCKYDPVTNRFSTWREPEGLPFDYVAGVEVDNYGNVWVSSWVNGIAMLNTKTNVIRTFGLNDGLQNLRFNRGSVYKDSEGKIYFGGVSGFNIIDPNVITERKIHAPVYITGIKINGTKWVDSLPVYDIDELQLDHNESEIQIDFIALAYSGTENIIYYYRLQGYSDEWKLAAERAAYYTNLDHGSYLFQVKAVNKLTGETIDLNSLTIDIATPFWMTTWFRLLMGVFAFGAVFGLVRLRTRALNRQKLALEKTVQERTHELAIAKDKAEKSEQFKQQFLANMSHEIRTPMNAVSGMTELLLENEYLPTQEKYLTAIQKSSETLLHIINDILDISKVESGKMELENIHFAIRDVVDQVVQTLQIRADEKSLHLVAQVSSRTPEVLIGDPHRLKQILINLGGNAIKFTDKGSVQLKVEPTNNGIQLVVVDTGIGIPQDKINLVFESFRQAQSSDTRKYGGTGLGLSISKQLIELQGGSIHVESEVGSGTKFTCVIPYAIGDAAQLKSQAANVEIDVKALKGLRVLVVDDNEFNRVVARDTLLSRTEMSVAFAENGKQAVEALQHAEFDVILMDVQMPEMNGYDATKYIRSKFSAPKCDIPIIALTASVLKQDLDKCKMAGMNSYVPKPFKVIQLFTAIAEVTERNIKTGSGKEANPKIVMSRTFTDINFLRAFTEGDEEALKRYIKIYIDKTNQHVLRLENAMSNEDFEELKTVVHIMKGHFKMMGMQETLKLASQIELTIDEGGRTACFADVRALIEQCRISVTELEKV